MTDTYSFEGINRTSPIPLYFQVSQILRKEIEAGIYKPGEYIPTEAELQERFNVSRATIRQAVAELVYSGLVERLRSKGTIVLGGFPETVLHDLASFTNEIMASNFSLTTKITEYETILPSETVRKNLELTQHEKITQMERIRYVDGKPVAVEKWYAPLKYFPGIKREMFKSSGMEQSTYYILMKYYNIKIDRAVDTVAPVGVEAREAKVLEINSGHPALLRTRISYSSDNRPVTYASGVYLIRLKFMLGRI